MDESSHHVPEDRFVRDRLQQSVHQIVAHVDAGAVGDLCRQSRFADLFRDLMDGQAGEVGGFSRGVDRFVVGKEAVVVRDRFVAAVDRHAFGCDVRPAFRKPHADHRAGQFHFHRFFQDRRRFSVDDGQL